jgi:hypothetical protein
MRKDIPAALLNKEQVRIWLKERWRVPRPLPELEQMRRELGSALGLECTLNEGAYGHPSSSH